jgi:hypothetical protein
VAEQITENWFVGASAYRFTAGAGMQELIEAGRKPKNRKADKRLTR